MTRRRLHRDRDRRDQAAARGRRRVGTGAATRPADDVDRGDGRRRHLPADRGGAGPAPRNVGGPIAGIGVGFGGPVDWRTGRICRSHQIDGWEGFPLRDWLAERSGGRRSSSRTTPTRPPSAKRSRRRHAGRRIGVLLQLRQRRRRGAGDAAARSTTAPRRARWSSATCGSAAGTARRSNRAAPAGPSTRASGRRAPRRRATARWPGWWRWTPAARPGNWPPRWRRGTRWRATSSASRGRHLAFALSHVVHLAHPDVLVLGGGLSLVGEPLRARVAEALPGYVMQAFTRRRTVRLAAVGRGRGAGRRAAPGAFDRPANPRNGNMTRDSSSGSNPHDSIRRQAHRLDEPLPRSSRRPPSTRSPSTRSAG